MPQDLLQRIAALRVPLCVGAASFALCVLTPPCPSPDGVEMAAAGAAALRNLWGTADLFGTEPFFWPPLFPAISGLLALALGPAAGAQLASLLGTALVLAGLARLADRYNAGLILPIFALATPAFRHYAMLGDARSLALAALVWAWAMALERKPGWRVGALLACAWLSRPEAGPTALLVLLALGFTQRRALLSALPTLLILVTPYLGLLSWWAGRPVFSPRDWMSAVTPWLAVLPMEWVQAELAAGTWGTPLRAAVSRLPPQVEQGPDWLGALEFLPTALPAVAPPWAWLAAAVGLVLARPRAWLLAIAAALALPALLVHVAPPARDEILPVNNLQPLLAAVILLGAVGLGEVASRSPRGEWVAAAGLAFAGWAGFGPLPQDFPVDTPLARASVAAVSAHVPAGEAVAASLSTAPWVLRSHHPRRRLPPPWMVGSWMAGPERTSWVLISWMDLPASARSLRAMQDLAGLDPVWSAQDGDAWAMLAVVRTPGQQGRRGPVQMPEGWSVAWIGPEMRARE